MTQPIPVLGIPFYNRLDLLDRCIASIDYPVDKLVLVQNGPTAYGYEHPLPECVKQLVYCSHPNAGVAGAWNEIIMLNPAPWWMLVNDDIQFTPGDLQKLADAAWAQHLDVAHLYGNHGASWFVITARCIDRAGLYDPCFWPAYLEDCDMSRRCDLIGEKRVNVQDCHAIHGEPGIRSGSCTVNSDPIVARENMRTHMMGFEYYKAKHGGLNGRETFTHVFNNPNLPVDYWKFNTGWRAKQQWKLS